MVAGIPGTSISGLFYILLAFMMPVKEAYHVWKRQSSIRRWLHIALQMINAVGIVGSIWATGWGLCYLIKKASVIGLHPAQVPPQFTNLMSLTSAFLALALLAIVLIAVLALSLIMPKRSPQIPR